MDITELNISNIYKNTIQTIIDIINEVMIILDNNDKNLYENLLNVF
jgi:flagellin-specific chaperone FliS